MATSRYPKSLLGLCLLLTVSTAYSQSPSDAIDWANLDKEKLSLLQPEDFHALTETELASIPAQAWNGLTPAQAQAIDGVACGGFSAAQIQQIPSSSFLFPASCVSRWSEAVTGAISSTQLPALPAASFEGFSTSWRNITASAVQSIGPEQIAALSTIACEQLTPIQMAFLSPAAFAGFTEKCTTHFRLAVWGSVTARQISHLPIAVVETFTAVIVTTLPRDTFAGLTAEQIKVLPPASASGMSSARFMALSSEKIEALTVEFVARTIVTIWRDVNAEKLSHLNATAGLSAQMVANIPASAFQGLNKEQVADFTVDRFGVHACKGLSALQIGQISPAAISGLRDVCITATNFTCWRNVTALQIESLTPQACAGFRWFHVMDIPVAAYAGFTAGCLQNIATQDRRACYGMQESGIELIKPPAFAGFQPACSMAAFIPTVTPQQLSYVDPATMQELNNMTISSLNPQAFSGLSAEQINVLQCGRFGACRGINSAQISHIRTSSMSGFSDACVRCSASTAWREITAEQLAGLSPSACGSFSAAQRVSMAAPTFSGYRNECISLSEPESWVGVQPSQLAKIPPTEFVGFTAIHIDFLKWSRAEIGFTADSMHYLRPSACGGFAGSMLYNIKPIAFSKVTGECLNYFRNSTIQHFSAQQVNAIPLDAFVEWRDVVFLRVDVFYNMDVSHVRNLYVPSLPANVVLTLIGNYTKDVVEYWTEPVLRNTSLSVIKQVKHSVAAGVLNDALLDDLPTTEEGAEASTWLKWALVRKSNTSTLCANEYTEKLIFATPDSAFYGLQPWKVPCIADWSALSPRQAYRILPDAAIAFTPSQFLSLSNASLMAVRTEVWAALPVGVFKQITAEQLRAALTPRSGNLTEEAYSSHSFILLNSLSCDQIGQIRSDQLIWLDINTQLKQFRNVRSTKCPDLPPLGLVSSVPAILPPGYSQPATSTGLWIGLGITLVVVVIAVPVLIYVGKRLRAARQGEEYWPLDTNFGGDDD